MRGDRGRVTPVRATRFGVVGAMKLVVLGAGGMGRYAARTAAAFDFVEDMLVGDLDGRGAARLADALGTKTRSAAVDVTDEAGLVRALSGADVVLNTVGPLFRLGPPVLRAAIRARCHYLDINDEGSRPRPCWRWPTTRGLRASPR